MYYEENLEIISKFDEILYDYLKIINNKEEFVNKNRFDSYIGLYKNLEYCNFNYLKENLELSKLENFSSFYSFDLSKTIKDNNIIIFLEEIYFLFFIKNLEKFNNNFVFFIFNDINFFNNTLKYFSLKNLNLQKCFFIFPFTKFDKINYFLNEIISKIETELIEEKLFEKIIFYPFIDFNKKNFFLSKILNLLNFVNKENFYINNIYSQLLDFHLKENRKLDINLEEYYINQSLFKDSFNKKIIILTELINLLFIKISDKKTYEKLIKNQIFNILGNSKYIENTLEKIPENPIFSLALVFGAGYSVNNVSIEKIKQIQKNGASIIVVDTVYKYFIKNGIIPDFVIVLDSQFLNYYDFIFYPKKYINSKNFQKSFKRNFNENENNFYEVEFESIKEIFLVEISSINKVSKVFDNIKKIFFASLLKDSNYSWVAANPLSFDLIKKLNINKLPSYGNVTLLALTFSLLFFENIYLFGFDSSFEKSIYHCKETLDYNYYLYRNDYKKTLLDNLTKFCLNKKINFGLKSSFELMKNKDIFEKEFYKFKDKIKINDFDLFKNNPIIEKKFDKFKFIKDYCREIEIEKLNNFKTEIKILKNEIENIFISKNLEQNTINKKLKELLINNELFQKIIFSIYYFNESKKSLINLDKKDLFLIKKLYYLFLK